MQTESPTAHDLLNASLDTLEAENIGTPHEFREDHDFVIGDMAVCRGKVDVACGTIRYTGVVVYPASLAASESLRSHIETSHATDLFPGLNERYTPGMSFEVNSVRIEPLGNDRYQVSADVDWTTETEVEPD